MELLHNLWNVLCTEDENLARYVSLSLIFIEIYVMFKLTTALLNISYTKKQITFFTIIVALYTTFTNLFLPNTINIFIGLFLNPLAIMIAFKIPFYKSMIAHIVTLVTVVVLETLYIDLCNNIFSITANECKNILIYRIPCMLTVYITILIISRIIKAIKINWFAFESLNNKIKKLILINLFLVLLCVAMQFYLLIFYNQTLPWHITLLSLLSLLAYSIVSIYSIIKTLIIENTKRNLEQAELHNKSLELLYNNVSAFKHDISNIVTALGGLIYSRNWESLENYYNKILDELNINNNLSTLNPQVINNPAIYNILATKYYKADELGITINLQIFINLNELKLDIYDFCRILGILLDNAIEASSKCEEKIINIDIHDVKVRKYQIITIENTYSNKNINLSKLAEKGYTSKTENKNSHGIGLWQVSKILNKHKNTLLDTSIDDKMFRQELIIYY